MSGGSAWRAQVQVGLYLGETRVPTGSRVGALVSVGVCVDQ